MSEGYEVPTELPGSTGVITTYIISYIAEIKNELFFRNEARRFVIHLTVVGYLRPRYRLDAVGGRLHGSSTCLHDIVRPSSCIRVVVQVQNDRRPRAVCMYYMVITYSKGDDQSGKVTNPARGQLNRDN